MRQIGSLNDENRAERFTAYLIVEGIPAHVDREGDQWEIWIKDEDQVEDAQQELNFFTSNPEDTRFTGVVEKAKAQIAEEVQRRKQQKKNVVSVRDQWPQGNRYRAPLTMTMIVLSVLAFVFAGFNNQVNSVVFKSLAYTYVSTESIGEDASLSDSPMVRNASLLKGEVWRLITPIFLHHGPWHILFNMIMFYQLGRVLEHKYGTLSYGLLILAIAVLSNFFQATMPAALDGSRLAEIGDHAIHAFAGMSGVVFGLFGLVWMKSVFDRASGFMLLPMNVAILIGWMMIGILGFDEKLFGFHMANWAHGVGLLVGMAVGYFGSPRQ